jgi:predicted metallo-beta-lactamase superfamily hydrolase
VEALLVPIAVALIGGPLMWLLHRFDRRNTEQHGENMRILQRVENKVDVLDAKVDRVDEKVWRHSNDKSAHQ